LTDVEELCPDKITFVQLEKWRSHQIQWGIFKKLPMLKAFMETLRLTGMILLQVSPLQTESERRTRESIIRVNPITTTL